MFCPPTITPALYKSLIAKYDHHLKYGTGGQTRDIMSGVLVGSCGEVRVSGGKGKGELAVYPGCNPFDLYKEYSALNTGQKDAVKKVLHAQDYALLLGLPGTGKTSTLSLIVRALIARDQKVLICSYTHSAVDNLLSKIAEAGVTSAMALRIGYSASVDSSMRRCTLDLSHSLSIIDNSSSSHLH